MKILFFLLVTIMSTSSYAAFITEDIGFLEQGVLAGPMKGRSKLFKSCKVEIKKEFLSRTSNDRQYIVSMNGMHGYIMFTDDITLLTNTELRFVERGTNDLEWDYYWTIQYDERTQKFKSVTVKEKKLFPKTTVCNLDY